MDQLQEKEETIDGKTYTIRTYFEPGKNWVYEVVEIRSSYHSYGSRREARAAAIQAIGSSMMYQKID